MHIIYLSGCHCGVHNLFRTLINKIRLVTACALILRLFFLRCLFDLQFCNTALCWSSILRYLILTVTFRNFNCCYCKSSDSVIAGLSCVIVWKHGNRDSDYGMQQISRGSHDKIPQKNLHHNSRQSGGYWDIHMSIY